MRAAAAVQCTSSMTPALPHPNIHPCCSGIFTWAELEEAGGLLGRPLAV
jgi:hypothetical protein